MPDPLDFNIWAVPVLSDPRTHVYTIRVRTADEAWRETLNTPEALRTFCRGFMLGRDTAADPSDPEYPKIERLRMAISLKLRCEAAIRDPDNNLEPSRTED